MSPALHSKSGCKFSQGRTPLRQQQNTELKFSTSSKEEDESNKPCSREKIALPREQEAINKKQNRLLRLQTAVIAVFFCFLGMQFNSILFEHRNLYIDADASRNATYRIHNESDQERQCILDVCSQNSAYVLQCNYIGSKNYTICTIHISNIFPTNWAENSQSAIIP